MKTINIEDKDFDYLKKLKNNILTQDNRCTRTPIVFEIRMPKKEWGFDSGYSDEFEYVDSDSDISHYDLDEFKKELIEYYDDESIKDLDEDELENKYNIRKVYYRIIEEIVHVFLTEEEANYFIKHQEHNYPNCYTYVHHYTYSDITELVDLLLRIKDI